MSYQIFEPECYKELRLLRCVNVIHNHVNRFYKPSVDDKKVLDMVRRSKAFLQEHDDIVITNADKGNVTVAIMADEYEKKMEELLELLEETLIK